LIPVSTVDIWYDNGLHPRPLDSSNLKEGYK
jgi:hypothetical protein